MEVLSASSTYTVCYYIVWLVVEALKIMQYAITSLICPWSTYFLSWELVFGWRVKNMHFCFSMIWFARGYIPLCYFSLRSLHVISPTHLIQLDCGNMHEKGDICWGKFVTANITKFQVCGHLMSFVLYTLVATCCRRLSYMRTKWCEECFTATSLCEWSEELNIFFFFFG